MLTGEENRLLIRLLGRLSWPVTREVFDALCENLSVTPVELAVVREGPRGPEVFMVYRKDAFFTGWHITGSIVLPGRSINDVLKDIVSREVGISLSGSLFEFIRVRQFMKGNGRGQNPRGQEVSLIHVLFLPEGIEVPLGAERKFFPIYDWPEDTLEHHKVVLADVREYLVRD